MAWLLLCINKDAMLTHNVERIVELLRKRAVPGSERREAERQAEFDARQGDTETEYCTSKSESEEESDLEF